MVLLYEFQGVSAMKQLKRGLVSVLILSLLVAFFPSKTLFALDTSTTTGTVTVGNVQGKTGDEVQITLSFDAPVTIQSLVISELDYDNNKLELIDGEWNLENAFIADWNSNGNNDGVLAFTENKTISGDFFTFTFKIIEDVNDGDTSVTCNVGARAKVSGGSDKVLDITVNEGKVTIQAIKKQIIVASGKGYLGKQISVPISLENNLGIASMLLSVNYDSSVLELVSVTDSEKLGEALHSDTLNAIPYTLCWMNSTITENITYNGEIVVLTFNVLDTATLGDTKIEVSYDYDNDDILDCDMNAVKFLTVDGTITISDVLLGDVNDDGKVNLRDGMVLQRYIARWSGYTAETINMAAADVNADGKVNLRDGMILQRHIAKWNGYKELPYTE